MDELSMKQNYGALNKNIGLSLSRRVVATVLQLLVVVIIARSLGPEGNGKFAIVIILPNLLNLLVGMGFGPAIVYYVGKGVYSSGEVFQVGLRMAGVTLAGSLLVLLPVLYLAHSILLPSIEFPILVLSIAALPAVQLNDQFSSLFLAEEDFNSYNLTQLIQPIVLLLNLLCLLLFDRLDILNSAVAFTASHYALSILLMVFIRYRLGKKSGMDLLRTREIFFHLAEYGYRAQAANIIGILSRRTDIFLINFFIGTSSTGVYAVASQISERMGIPSAAISNVLFPRLVRLSNSPQEGSSLILRYSLVACGISIVGSCILAVFGKPLISLVFGSAFTPAYTALVILIPGIITTSAGKILANSIAAMGRPGFNSVSAAVALFINLVGNLILIPSYGIAGAAAATSFSQVVKFAIRFRYILLLSRE